MHEPSTGLSGESKTATCVLPPRIAQLVNSGVELGHANDEVFAKHNSKHGSGMVGSLTGDLITRTTYYEQAALLALAPFRNRDLYKNITE